MDAAACTCPDCPESECRGVHKHEARRTESNTTPKLVATKQEEDAASVVMRFEEWEEWDASTPFWKHALAGSCAGVMEHIGMYPLDTVKTHMQALRPGERLRLVDVVRNISQESELGFMRGCAAIASGCIPAHIALFTMYELSKKRLLKNGDHRPLNAAICGAVSTFCHDIILTPMDLVKQRMQLGHYSGIGDCLKQVRRREGLGALFRSMPTTLAMNLPFGSVLVASNESLKQHFRLDVKHHRRDDPWATLPWYFASAGISGAVASGATQPLDVIKTRLQTQDLLMTQPDISTSQSSRSPTDRANISRPKYSGFFSAFSTIWREEGLLALYRGLLPRMLHAIPAASMCWGTYETVKRLLDS